MAKLRTVPAPAAATHPLYFRIAGTPDREYFVYCPAECPPGAEPLVLVHGISRNAIELALRFAPLARQFGVPIVAPLFSAQTYGMYQQVVDPRRGIRADLALFDMLDHAASRFGMEVGRFAVFGFSGGGQFAHRLALLHPARVTTCLPVSAGWYTMPDPALDWPLGLAGAPLGPIDLATASGVPFHILVGRRDTQNEQSLRRSPKIDALQGENRLKRARAWHRALHRAGLNTSGSLTELPRTRHNFASANRRGLAETVFALLGHRED